MTWDPRRCWEGCLWGCQGKGRNQTVWKRALVAKTMANICCPWSTNLEKAGRCRRQHGVQVGGTWESLPLTRGTCGVPAACRAPC